MRADGRRYGQAVADNSRCVAHPVHELHSNNDELIKMVSIENSFADITGMYVRKQRPEAVNAHAGMLQLQFHV